MAHAYSESARHAAILFSLSRALCGGFQHGLLNGLNDRVRILARGQGEYQLIPEPLARSGKIEVVALDGETVCESNTSPGLSPELLVFGS